jgi:transcription antitermination factor NusB
MIEKYTAQRVPVDDVVEYLCCKFPDYSAEIMLAQHESKETLEIITGDKQQDDSSESLHAGTTARAVPRGKLSKEEQQKMKEFYEQEQRAKADEPFKAVKSEYAYQESDEESNEESDKDLNGWVETQTKNWESDRLAMTDFILLKMAIAEMIKFPSIPVKVSINEYIELAKNYSTPKSGQFINGILDEISIRLMSEKIIQKSGRGLIDIASK